MNKSEFLGSLLRQLEALPKQEAEKTAAYYSEIIDDRCEDGMTEAEAVASLEDVDTIARQIICDTPLQVLVKERIKKPNPWVTPLIVVLLIIGSPVWMPLLITALSVALTLFIVIWVVVLCLFAVVLAIAASGIAAVVAGLMTVAAGPAKGLLLIGAGFVCFGLSVFAYYAAAAAAKLCARFIRWAGRRFKRGFLKKEVEK